MIVVVQENAGVYDSLSNAKSVQVREGDRIQGAFRGGSAPADASASLRNAA